MKQALILLLSLIVINSCKEYPCDEATLSISIKGFAKSEIDSVIVKKYVKSSNFSTILATSVIDSSEIFHSWAGNSLEVIVHFTNEYGLRSKFDYDIYIPLQNRLYKITEIVEEPTTGKEKISMEKSRCMNNIKSYKVDGRLVSTSDTFYSVELTK